LLGSLKDGLLPLRDDVPRARRYPVNFAIEYRRGRLHDWQTGVTRNVSASGVLFTEANADRALAPQEAIDMRLIIPSNTPGRPATRVLCTGRVTRIVPPGGSDQPRAVAATIGRYRLLRSDHTRGTESAESQ
jgi:hypothetical protein